MSFRLLFKQRSMVPFAATLLAGSIALYPTQVAFAEEPQDAKKPIYDDTPTQPSGPTSRKASAPPEHSAFEPPSTPTDILTTQVRQARLFLYSQSLAAENSFNAYLSRALNIENAFTNTIASLAPSAESDERLLPDGVYVIVSAMAGSIVSRSRGLLLRTMSPIAFGTVAAWSLLPVTMRNVSNLVWEYEKKVPALAEQHLAIREKGEEVWRAGVECSKETRQMMESRIGDARKKLEELVSRGH